MELKRYKGSLTLEQLIVAHKKIIDNAKSLYGEAQLLFEHSMYARSYFLLCIANEELGKSVMVISAAVDLIAGSIDWNSFWRKLRNHKKKTGTMEFIENVLVSSDENFTPFEDVQKQIPVFEEIKMASLYADMFQNDFFSPNEIVSERMVKGLIELTGHRIDLIDATSPQDEMLRTITKESILLYREKLSEMGINIFDRETAGIP